MRQLQETIGYTFQNQGLLDHALTHSSYANEKKLGALGCNERLEFLGDSVLGMVTADYLYRTYDTLPEGELTRTRATLVCEGSLAQVAEKLGLGEFMKLGRGEDAGGGRSRPSILADAVEAIIAAIYLDGGIGSARKFIHQFLLEGSKERAPQITDFKTALQEVVQRNPGQTLAYRLTGSEGPDHAKLFMVEVDLNGTPIGKGKGRSKKEAEQQAAKDGLTALEEGGTSAS